MNHPSNRIELPLIREHEFNSPVPVIGPFISWVRRALYSLTAKWGVRFVLDQQNQINQLIAQQLREFEIRLEELDMRLIEQDRDLAPLSRAVAELEIRQRYLVRTLHLPTHADAADGEDSNSVGR
jgi:hypothetical protein